MKTVSPGDTLIQPVCLMIGNFDGVHLGHQAILRRAMVLAAERGYGTALISFEPHPLKLLAPERAPLLIQTQRQKAAMLRFLGLDHYLPLPFTRVLSQLTPRDFIAALRRQVNFRILLVGFNFRFGHKRAGDTETLAELAKEFDFELVVIPPQLEAGEPLSSSRVRLALQAGELEKVEQLLGRPYYMEGEVRAGRQIGRKIGIATANIEPENELLPRLGVYATWTRVDTGWFRSISNLGLAPTVGDGKIRLETHLFEFEGELYEQRLIVSFGSYLRAEQKFPDLAALKTRIEADWTQRLAMRDSEPPHSPLFDIC